MKRGLLALFAVGVLIAATLLFRGAIAPEAARHRLETAASAWVGRPVALTGEVEARLLPWPRLVWSATTLLDRATGASLATAARIETPLALWPLLRGRIVPDTIELVSPHARLDRPDTPVLPNFAGFAALPALDLRIEDGLLDLVGPDGGLDQVRGIGGRLSHAGADASVDADLTATWRGEGVRLKVDVPTGVVTDRWSLAAGLGEAELKISGRGRADRSAFDGDVSLAVPDPARLGRLVTAGPLADLLRAPIGLDAVLTATATSATLTDLRLRLGRSTAEGTLAFAGSGREPALSGTLAFSDLSFSDEPPIFGDGWQAVALDQRRLGLALDLRVSAKRLIAPRFELTRFAASLNLAEGRLNAEIGDAALWGRPVSVVIAGELGADGLAARVRGLAKDLPAAELGTLFAVDGVEDGKIAASFEGETRCAALGGCAGAIDGRLRLSAVGLSVTGGAPFGDVTRFHPIVVTAKPAAKRTLWSEAEADVHLSGTAARVDAVEMRGADARFALKGTGDLGKGSVQLAGHAYFRDRRQVADPATEGEIRIPLRVTGTLHRLEITPAMPEQVPPTPQTVPLSPIPIVPPVAVPTR